MYMYSVVYMYMKIHVPSMLSKGVETINKQNNQPQWLIKFIKHSHKGLRKFEVKMEHWMPSVHVHVHLYTVYVYMYIVYDYGTTHTQTDTNTGTLNTDTHRYTHLFNGRG